ncbi:hypothetical protein J6590_052094 [Homalodisca vitripennis]|nr:hypothetical protein J6590_052094 [Homalodisca vitripennis]
MNTCGSDGVFNEHMWVSCRKWKRGVAPLTSGHIYTSTSRSRSGPGVRGPAEYRCECEESGQIRAESQVH